MEVNTENVKPPQAAEQPKNSPADHLKPFAFKPGESGNPSGRPKGSVSITAGIRKALAEIPPGEKRTRLAQVVDILIEKAIKQKDFPTLQRMWAYMDGLPKATVAAEFDEDQLATLTDFFRGMAKPKTNDTSGTPTTGGTTEQGSV